VASLSRIAAAGIMAHLTVSRYPVLCHRREDATDQGKAYFNEGNGA
jgi:hypothetical protein